MVTRRSTGLKPWMAGILAAAALLGFYFLLLTIANSWKHALEQFLGMWYWVMALATGFGIQAGLFSYIRSYIKGRVRAGVTAELAGTGGVSTGAMVACCAHHLSDVLPILGISAALVFLDKYQFPLILAGGLSNIVGITIILTMIQKHQLYDEHGLMSRVLKGDIKKMRNAAIALSVIILAVTFLLSCQSKNFTPPDRGSAPPSGPTTSSNNAGGVLPPAPTTPAISSNDAGSVSTPKAVPPLQLTSKANNEAGITIEVVPESVSPGKPSAFRITMDTHSGSLNFNLTKIAVLKDGIGNEYLPLEWKGDAPGGHHFSGTLVFPSLKDQPQSLTLILKDIGGVKERKFTWS